MVADYSPKQPVVPEKIATFSYGSQIVACKKVGLVYTIAHNAVGKPTIQRQTDTEPKAMSCFLQYVCNAVTAHLGG